MRGARMMSSGRVLVDFDANLCHAALKDSIDHHMTKGKIMRIYPLWCDIEREAECLRLSEEKGPRSLPRRECIRTTWVMRVY